MRRLPRPAVTNSVISSLSSLQFAPTDMAREKHSLSEHTTLATCSTKSVPSPSSGSGESGPYEPGPEDASSCWRAPHGGLSIRHALLACLEGGTARAVACEADTLMTPLVAPTAAMQAKSLGHRVRTTGAGLACALADDNGVADRPYERSIIELRSHCRQLADRTGGTTTFQNVLRLFLDLSFFFGPLENIRDLWCRPVKRLTSHGEGFPWLARVALADRRRGTRAARFAGSVKWSCCRSGVVSEVAPPSGALRWRSQRSNLGRPWRW